MQSVAAALAESVNGLNKAELLCRHQGPWRSVDKVEFATAGWVRWWDTARPHEACGYLPPAEFEAALRSNHRGSPRNPVRFDVDLAP